MRQAMSSSITGVGPFVITQDKPQIIKYTKFIPAKKLMEVTYNAQTTPPITGTRHGGFVLVFIGDHDSVPSFFDPPAMTCSITYFFNP